MNNNNEQNSDLYNNDTKANREEDNDYKVYIERILSILDTGVEKLECITILPSLMKNDGAYLWNSLPQDEVVFILEVCGSYREKANEEHQSSEISNALDKIMPSLKDKLRKANEEDCYKINVDNYVSQVVDILFNRKGCLPEVKTVTKSVEIEHSLIKFIARLKEFRKIMQQKLSITAAQELSQQKMLSDTYRSNSVLKENINKITEKLEKFRKKHNTLIDSKNDLIDHLKEQSNEIRRNQMVDMEKIITTCEKRMMEEVQQSEILSDDLSVQARESVQQYQSLLEDHMLTEKLLRSKRFKIETQLSGWIAKYDTDRGEKQLEYDKIKEEHDDLESKILNLQELLDNQQDEYETLMSEKEDEENRIFNEMAIIFLYNRSARRIQRYWRAYRERKRNKRRKKSKKKKK